MISVIVPVYGVESYLDQCIDSIRSQTYNDLEMLIIDDGSPDRCGEICEKYAELDDRIRVFHTENRGLSAARNMGLDYAKGEYVSFVDADDWIEPNMFTVLISLIQVADISVGGFWYEHDEYQQVWKEAQDINYKGVEAIRALINGEINNTVWGKLYKKECWDDIRFPEGHVHEDISTIYKVLMKGYVVVGTSMCLYHYRQRKNSISRIRSMNHLKDNWDAFYQRYIDLKELFRNDLEMLNKLEVQIVSAANSTWHWIYIIPKEKRDYNFLNKLSYYIRERYPFYGNRQWGKYLRISTFFVRYVNEASFMISCYLYRGYLLVISRKY